MYIVIDKMQPHMQSQAGLGTLSPDMSYADSRPPTTRMLVSNRLISCAEQGAC